jgi:hypothetical protein
VSARARALLLAALHALLVLSLAGKLFHDRATRPRVWVRTAPYDPDLLFRGRYVRLALEVDGKNLLHGDEPSADVVLTVEDDQLVAHRSSEATGATVVHPPVFDTRRYRLGEPVAFFIPEHIDDPSLRAAGEELWAEVTVPRRGPPRPIRLGLRKDGELVPLD